MLPWVSIIVGFALVQSGITINLLQEKQIDVTPAAGTSAVGTPAATVASGAGTASTAAASAPTGVASANSTSANSTSSSNSSGFTDADFKKAVAALGKPDAGAKSTYFIQALGDTGVTSRREVAMFLAQVWHESGALVYKEEIACSGDEAKKVACDSSYKNTNGGKPGKHYYGRGYIQLTGDANYEAASKDLLGDGNILLNDPDKVASDEALAWRTAAWYWKKFVHTAPGVAEGKFGATTKAINGKLECTGSNQNESVRRFTFYQTILKAIGDTSPAIESGCYN